MVKWIFSGTWYSYQRVVSVDNNLSNRILMGQFWSQGPGHLIDKPSTVF